MRHYPNPSAKTHSSSIRKGVPSAKAGGTPFSFSPLAPTVSFPVASPLRCRALSLGNFGPRLDSLPDPVGLLVLW